MFLTSAWSETSTPTIVDTARMCTCMCYVITHCYMKSKVREQEEIGVHGVSVRCVI